MKTLQTTEQTVHQYIEQALRHRLAILIVTVSLVAAIVHFDSRFQRMAQQAYNQGFGWIGTYMHHEHPMHGRLELGINRIPTISGTG